jgi:anti-sigma regulatory factor (Ser/Thr protein kinase)
MTARSNTRTVCGPGPGTAFHRTSFLEFAPLPGAIPCARLHAVAVLHEWGLRHLAGDVALIVSELMTNAADASVALPDRPPIALRLLASEKSLIIEAWDHSPRDLEPSEPDADAECGRGLTVVAALSDRWGWERTGHHRKVVWAELALRAGCTST